MTPELQQLQGTWNIISLEVDGDSLPAGDGRIVILKDSFESLGMGPVYKGKLSLDTAQKPWAIDMKFTAGPEQGNVNRGIFEFKGDSWRLCLQMTGGDRPAKFSTRGGGGLALEVLERFDPEAKPATKSANRKPAAKATKAAQAPKVDFPSDPVPELAGEWAMITCVMNGQPLEAEYVRMGRRVATGNETTIYMGEHPILQARYAIRRDGAPDSIDYLLKNGQVQEGIFRLGGQGLEVCFSPVGKPRPKEFSSVKGDGRTWATWKLLPGK